MLDEVLEGDARHRGLIAFGLLLNDLEELTALLARAIVVILGVCYKILTDFGRRG